MLVRHCAESRNKTTARPIRKSQKRERLKSSGVYGPEGLSDGGKFCADVICGGEGVEIDSWLLSSRLTSQSSEISLDDSLSNQSSSVVFVSCKSIFLIRIETTNECMLKV